LFSSLAAILISTQCNACADSLTLAGVATEPSPSLETTNSGEGDKGDNNPFDALLDDARVAPGVTVVSALEVLVLLFRSNLATYEDVKNDE
jgi:hypothetical protein